MPSKNKNKKSHRQFSMLESLSGEEDKRFHDKHFSHVLANLQYLEIWLKKRKVKNGWTLQEKLSFLRNVEANIRTGAALRRTQLSWLAFTLGVAGLAIGWLIGSSS